jgi:ribonuclease H / adenosylcobalamin/alpha-ribazole phosphatase
VSRRFVVEADGGSRGNPGPAGYGALVRDPESGEVLVEIAEALGVVSNNVAEYGGLVAGLRAAVQLDPECTIEVRMDSKLVVEQMSGRWKIKHEDMRRLALEAREVVDPARVRYTWVPRERNKAADRLANEAMDDAGRGLPWRGRARATVATAPEATAAGSQATEATAGPAAAGPDVGRATTVVLLRHGATAHTSEWRFSGPGGADPSLSELGVAQANAAAAALAARGGFDAVVASPMRRTVQTAEVVAARLGLPVRLDDGWVEGTFGEWEGLTAAEVVERWPQEHGRWLASTAAAPPGGESLDALAARVGRARDRTIARQPRGTVLVVAHAGPIKALVRAALGGDATMVWRLESAPASITTTRWWSDGNSSLVSFNETAHLLSAGLALR